MFCGCCLCANGAANRLSSQSMGMAHFVWISPLQCILSVGMVWELIDVNGFCALAAISLLGIIQAGLSHKMGPYK